MRFIDEATIQLKAGHGGPGSVSFRREKFIPRGGPDGGDGGDGANIVVKANAQLGTLQDFRFKRIYQAPAGEHGSGTNKAGRDGEHLEVQVPVGTVIKDAETGELLMDFTEDGQEWLACKGGRGGKGNAHFVSSTHQAPKFAQPGLPGEEKNVRLELKLLADAAIIGFPNAGKSTLISRISAARPKVADYAFTTLTPNLGVVAMPDHQSFVVADTPGLIEGAHAGLGLGHRFLKHIERNRVFIHLLDSSPLLDLLTQPDEGVEPIGQTKQEKKRAEKKAIKESKKQWAVEPLKLPETEDKAFHEMARRYEAIRRELGLYNEDLLLKPEIVVMNKLDLFSETPELLEKARAHLHAKIQELRGEQPCLDGEPFMISAVSGQGMDRVLGAVWRFIEESRKKDAKPQERPLV